MRKFMVLAALVLALAVPAVTAHAVPSLGVATNVAYIGSTGQTGLEPYQDYFVNRFVPGTDTEHGFVVGESGSNLTVFTNWVDVPIYLLWTSSMETANNPRINGVEGSYFGAVGQFDGYRPADYYGVLLGAVSDAWSPLPAGIFTPDGNRGRESGGGSDNPDFYSLAVQLAYSGEIASGTYFFAIADTNGDGPSGNGNSRSNYDAFSPKTTSATGSVPEPGSFVILGVGLVGLAGWGRRKFRK